MVLREKAGEMLKKYLRKKIEAIVYNILNSVPESIVLKKGVKYKIGVKVDYCSEIGEYSYLGPYTTITKSKIGRYVSIGENVSIGSGEHTLDRISLNSIFYKNSYEELTKLEDTIIEDDVWLGTNVFVKRGIKIGRGSAIGANSVITKDIPPYSVVVGVNRILKRRFSEDEIQIIEKSKWWEKDKDEAKKILESLEKTFENLKVKNNESII